jgi:co-chaperonin GroES (HSP10)
MKLKIKKLLGKRLIIQRDEIKQDSLIHKPETAVAKSRLATVVEVGAEVEHVAEGDRVLTSTNGRAYEELGDKNVEMILLADIFAVIE